MSYLCAGVYAEGSTDYAFLRSLLDQMLPQLTRVLNRVPTIGDSVGIDVEGKRPPARRAERIAAAIDAYWGQCTLFVLHGDGGGDAARALCERILPGIDLARAAHPGLAVAACVPVREIEAWLLVDERPFKQLLSPSSTPRLPSDPEAVRDPKAELERILIEGRGAKLQTEDYAFFGANSGLESLRRLPAFRHFEGQLMAAIKIAAGEP